MIDRIEFDADFPGGKKHIEITAPMGAGGIYHITVDRGFQGQLMCSKNGQWTCALNSKTILTGDDVSLVNNIPNLASDICKPFKCFLKAWL